MESLTLISEFQILIKVTLHFILLFLLVDSKECDRTSSLGLSNGYFRSAQMTASSVHSDATYGPSQARLDIYSSWCGNAQGPSNWIHEWLQFDFNEVVTLTGIALQGNRRSAEMTLFVTSFYLQISNSGNGSSFTTVTNQSGDTRIFEGVTNNKDAVFNWFKKSLKTRYVRFRPKSLNNGKLSTARACARVEFYGCGGGTGKAECKSLYALGMHNQIITDSQLSASSKKYLTTDPTKARFNRIGRLGWCPQSTSQNEWLRIDLGLEAVVAAFAIQGDGYGDYVARYHVSIANTTNDFKYIRDNNGSIKNFPGNLGATFQDPAFSLLENTVVARYIQVSPQERGKNAKEYCMRFEVFGYHQDGQDEILSYDQAIYSEGIGDNITKKIAYRPLISMLSAHCVNTSLGAAPFLQIKLSTPRLITGFALQGDPTSRQWVTSFKISYDTGNGNMTMLEKTFIGNVDQMDIGRYWFPVPITIKVFRVIPLAWETKPCLRLQLYGIFDGGIVDVEEGKPIFLNCPARICPKINVSWYFNNTALNFTDEILEISKVNRSDAGNYHCLASDKIRSQVSPYVTLNVEYIDQPMVKGRTHVTVNESDSINILCYGTGNPNPHITWSSNVSIHLKSNSTLHISKVKRNQSGIYTCSSENKVGSKHTSLKLDVYYLDQPSTNANNAERIQEGNALNITCSGIGNPKPQLDWQLPNSGDTSGTNGNLVIYNISRHAKGTVYCEAKNRYGSKKTSFQLEVLYIDDPKFNVSYNHSIQEGHPLIVKCKVTSFPPADVTWIDENNRTISSGPLLNISRITRHDNEIYTCQGVNADVGKTRKSFRVNLEYLDSPLVIPGNVLNIREYSSVTVTCKVQGNPVPSLFWFLPNNTRLKSSNGTQTFTNISRDLAGKVFCESTNSVGTKRSYFNVTVAYMDDPFINISSPATIKEGESMTVLCQVNSYPRASLYWTSDNNSVVSTGPILQLDKIRISDRKSFLCRTNNTIIGLKDQSLELNIQYIRMPDINITNNATITEGKDLTVNCQATGNPTPLLHWKTEHGREVSKGNTLQIHAIQRQMEGVYICIASNTVANMTRALHVNVYYIDELKLSIPSPLEVQEGDTVIIHCNASSHPQASLSWYDEQNTTVSTESSLILSNISRAGKTKYKCQGQNAVASRTKLFSLDVQYLDKPTLNVSSKLSVEEGESLIAMCTSESNPVSKAVWKTSNGIVISNSSILSFLKVRKSMADRYICTTNNGIYSKNTTFSLSVEYTNCTETPCQHRSKCTSVDFIEKCRCTEGHYGRYCDKVAKGFITKYVFYIFKSSSLQLSTEETRAVVGANTSSTFKAYTNGIKKQIEASIKSSPRLAPFFLRTELKGARISSIAMDIVMYMKDSYNSSSQEVKQSISDSFKSHNYSFTLPLNTSLQFKMDPNKLEVTDYDECTAGTHQCKDNFICVNTNTTYNCSCNSGKLFANGSCIIKIIPDTMDDRELVIIISAVTAGGILLIILLIIVYKCSKRRHQKSPMNDRLSTGHSTGHSTAPNIRYISRDGNHEENNVYRLKEKRIISHGDVIFSNVGTDLGYIK